MASDSTAHGRVRIPIRLEKFLATVEVPAVLADRARALLIDEIRAEEQPTGARVVIDETGVLTVDGRKWDPGDDQTVFDQLVYVLLQASLDADPERLHLHAGYVSQRGHGVLIGGLAGSGKSTLVAQLVEAGFDYHTDERVAVDENLRLGPFPKAVSVVAGSFALLRRVAPALSGLGASSPRLWHVPASALRPGSVGNDPGALAAIALVEYREGATLSCTPMHPVTVARVLLTDSIDVDRFGVRGPMVVARLCASVPCVAVMHGGQTEVADLFATLLAGSSSYMAPEVLPVVAGQRGGPYATGTVSASSMLGPEPGLCGAVVADRALLRTTSGSLVELDESQTAWFQLLDGETSLETLAHEVAGAVGADEAIVKQTAIGIAQDLVTLGVAR